MDGQANRPALVGQRARHRLADPPGRVRRKLVAHAVVELLHRADQAEIAFLDQVEQRHAGLRVVARDRHDEAQVRLDQLPLRDLVAGVLAAGELALLGAGQERAAADRADVELEGILDLECALERLQLLRGGLDVDLRVVDLGLLDGLFALERGHEFEPCLDFLGGIRKYGLWQRPLTHC